MMQAPPQMMTAEMSKERTMNMVMALAFLAGILLLAVAVIVWHMSRLDPANITTSELDMANVWAPSLWALGMFLLLTGLIGTAVMRKDIDPLGRLLLWLVTLIVVLILFTSPIAFFTMPPPVTVP